MPPTRRLVIVGGGITGLAAAHAAVKHVRASGVAWDVTVLERSARFGGSLQTERVDGFLLDAAADSWVVTKPHATELARELGLGGSLVGTRPEHRTYYVAHAGRLHPVPEGLVLGVPTRLGPLAATGLFSWPGKLRMACEPFVRARRFEGDDDESIGAFAERRLGREAADRLVTPLLGGISGGDASEISVRASFPQLVDMERKHGSLVRGMRAAARARRDAQTRAGTSGSAFVSLRGGTGELVDALVSSLGAAPVALRTGVAVRAVERVAAGWSLALDDGSRLDADAVVLAVPAPEASRLVRHLDPALAPALDAVAYGATATVFVGYRRAEVHHPLDGVGFVVPRSAGRRILAATWVSSKWEARAPDDHVLLRAFLSGDEARAPSDATLVDVARAELRSLMALDADPVLARVFRFASGSAQMKVGHLARMRAAHEALARVAPGLRLAAGGLDGVGIPDCVRQGQEAARALLTGD